MHKKLKKNMLFGFFFTLIFGSLLHFLYDWTNHNLIIAAFSPINESTWEHLKLIFTPTIIYIICSCYFWPRKVNQYLTASLIGLITGLISVIVLFYTYTGIIGTHYLVVDISIFVLSTVITYLIPYIMMKKKESLNFPLVINLFIIIILLSIFIYFSYYPPSIPLFSVG